MRSLAHFVVAVVCFGSFVVDSQWGTADAEIEVSSTDRLNSFVFEAWSRSEYRHAYFFHCQEFLFLIPRQLPVQSKSFLFFFSFFPNLSLGFSLALGVVHVNHLC